jgi:hypothetical protein
MKVAETDSRIESLQKAAAVSNRSDATLESVRPVGAGSE